LVKDYVIKAFFDILTKRRVVAPIDAIFISGDLAARGKPDEYRQRVKQFIGELLLHSGLDPSRLFMVPGNHDVDWEAIRPYHKMAFPGTLEASDEIFGSSHTLALLAEKFAGFRLLAHDFPGAWRGGRYPYLARVFRHKDARVGVVGLNSAWLVGGDSAENADRHKLLVGRRLMNRAFDEVAQESPDIVFVLMHHPYEWLMDFEAGEVRTLLLSRAHVVLNGHRHTTDVTRISTRSGEASILQAGCLFQDAAHPRQFHLGSWDAAEGRLEVTPYIHSGDSVNSQWVIDHQECDMPEASIRSLGIVSRGTAQKQQIASGPLELAVRAQVTWPTPEEWGDPVACVFIEGPSSVLDQVRSVRYTRTDGNSDACTLLSDARNESFLQTVASAPGQEFGIRTVVTFKDFSQCRLDDLRVTANGIDRVPLGEDGMI